MENSQLLTVVDCPAYGCIVYLGLFTLLQRDDVYVSTAYLAASRSDRIASIHMAMAYADKAR